MEAKEVKRLFRVEKRLLYLLIVLLFVLVVFLLLGKYTGKNPVGLATGDLIVTPITPDQEIYWLQSHIVCEATGDGVEKISLQMERFSPDQEHICSGSPCIANFSVPVNPTQQLAYTAYDWSCTAHRISETPVTETRTLTVSQPWLFPSDYGVANTVRPNSGTVEMYFDLVDNGNYPTGKGGGEYFTDTYLIMKNIGNNYRIDEWPQGIAAVVLPRDVTTTPTGLNNQDVKIAWESDINSPRAMLLLDVATPSMSTPDVDQTNDLYESTFTVSTGFGFDDVEVTVPIDTEFTQWQLFLGGEVNGDPTNPATAYVIFQDLDEPLDVTSSYSLDIDATAGEATFTFDTEESSMYDFKLVGTKDAPTSTYTVTIWEDENIPVDEPLTFYAEIVSDSTGQAIQGSFCELQIDGNTYPMSWDSTNQYYTKAITFSSDQVNKPYQIRCGIAPPTITVGGAVTILPALGNTPSYGLLVGTSGYTLGSPTRVLATLTDQDTAESVTSETCKFILDATGQELLMTPTSTQYRIDHTFAEVGEHTFTVACTRGAGEITQSKTIMIYDTDTSYIATVEGEDDKKVGETITFTGTIKDLAGITVAPSTCVLAVDGKNTAMGISGTTATTTHVFEEAGEATATMTCSVNGESVEASTIITVLPVDAQFSLRISADTNKRPGEVVTFYATVTDLASDEAISADQCSLVVDGKTKNMPYASTAKKHTAIHIFDAQGDKPYTITCIVDNEDRLASNTVTIHAPRNSGSPLLLKGSPLLLKGVIQFYTQPETPPPAEEVRTATFTYNENITKVVVEYPLTEETIDLDLFRIGQNPFEDLSGKVYGLYKLNASLGVNYAVISFRIQRSWLEANNVVDQDVNLLRYDEGWISLPTFYEEDIDEYATFTAYSSDLGYVALTGPETSIDENGVTTIVNAPPEDDILQRRRDIDPHNILPEKQGASQLLAMLEGITVPSWVWYGGAGVLGVLILVAIIVSIVKNVGLKPAEVDPQMLEQIRQYYLDCYNQGLAPEQIYENLLEVGWDREVLDQIFNRAF